MGPHGEREKSLNPMGFKPTISGTDHRCIFHFPTKTKLNTSYVKHKERPPLLIIHNQHSKSLFQYSVGPQRELFLILTRQRRQQVKLIIINDFLVRTSE